MTPVNFNLSHDQRRLIDIYVNQYNQAISQIVHLNDTLSEIGKDP